MKDKCLHPAFEFYVSDSWASLDPRMWNFMVKTVVSHSDRMDIKTFVKHFIDDYPQLADFVPAVCER